jgi:hypothetical protein
MSRLTTNGGEVTGTIGGANAISGVSVGANGGAVNFVGSTISSVTGVNGNAVNITNITNVAEVTGTIGDANVISGVSMGAGGASAQFLNSIRIPSGNIANPFKL